MRIQERHFTSIWTEGRQAEKIFVIDQRIIPRKMEVVELTSCEDAIDAISGMVVRGAPLIGVTAAWAVFLALREKQLKNLGEAWFLESLEKLLHSRPTAVNLKWAVNKMLNQTDKLTRPEEKTQKALETASRIMQEDAEACKKIGENGLGIIRKIFEQNPNRPVNIMTHCNAGWLACVDFGTATSPVYLANKENIPVHVWVSETRPRLQGAITAWELHNEGIPNTLIADNAAGHLMRTGKVDLCIVGSDRVALNGDVANKTGTYLKALAARDNHIPFYAALPISTIDSRTQSGADIPIEERSEEEVLFLSGMNENKPTTIRLFHEGAKASNYGFDVTPANLVTGLITERGVIPPDQKSIAALVQQEEKKIE
jgi:methylthioribose-1-phosphate isomerase